MTEAEKFVEEVAEIQFTKRDEITWAIINNNQIVELIRKARRIRWKPSVDTSGIR